MEAILSPVIVALDVPDEQEALSLAKRLDPGTCRLKVGNELFTACGPAFVERLQQLNFEVFLDLKYHDIPNTVAAAVTSAARLGVWMVNVHASGGRRMLEAARDAIEVASSTPKLIGVTVLTSVDQADYAELGLSVSLEAQVERLALLCRDSGLAGVVCSAREASRLRAVCGEDFCLVTPGIRPAGSQSDDQRRVVTPADAMSQGSSYLVIGRPITRAADPAAALAAINFDLGVSV